MEKGAVAVGAWADAQVLYSALAHKHFDQPAIAGIARSSEARGYLTSGGPSRPDELANASDRPFEPTEAVPRDAFVL